MTWYGLFSAGFFWEGGCSILDVPSLKLTANAPENGWLENDPFLLGRGLFSGAVFVLGSAYL